jgi:beta-lactamase class A
VVLLLVGCGPVAAAGTTPTAPTTTAQQGGAVPVPDTAAGRQLRWVLDQLDGDSDAPTDAELEERFAPAFLQQVPGDQLREVLSQFAGAAPWALVSVADEQGESLLRAIVRGADGAQSVTIAVEPEEPFRIVGLLFEPAAAASWDDVDAALETLGPRVNFLAAEVTEGGCSSIHARDAGDRLAVGSTFKLYVLGELARQIADGQASWDETLPIQESLKSVPSGDLRFAPAGTAHTLRYFAELMISQSDNTATDHLLSRLGRENVEAIQTAMGHGDATTNTPLLSTREFSVLKVSASADQRDAYVDGSIEERRNLLETVIGPLPLPTVGELAAWTTPRLIDEIEWFASAAELCSAMAYLHEQAGRPGLLPVAEILSLNPGGVIDRETWPTLLFKGGSEPGVLNLTYLAVRRDGRAFVLTLGVNDPERAVDEQAASEVALRAAGLLAQA